MTPARRWRFILNRVPRPSQLIHALRTARPRQLRARALRPLRRRDFRARPRPGDLCPLLENVELWRTQAFARLDARPEPSSRLAAFHEHYGEDVLEAARSGQIEQARITLRRWISLNPPRPGSAWHPYPLSTRVASWIAALSLEPSLIDDQAGDSIWRQLEHLNSNVEDDILGNHVIRNAKALVLGGAAFGDNRLLQRGRALLARELPEQVLPDGGHYERSPAYHRLVLRDLLELAPYASVAGEISRMTDFASASSRPDGAPALFNDGGLDIAPVLDLPTPPEGIQVFPDTGYVFVRAGRLWLAFDCGPPAPPYLPAHAHADALSIQLWWDGKPVVVDAGTSTYEPSEARDWDRSTRAHSTVSIDERNQFEPWGSFRSGPLPTVELEAVGQDHAQASVSWSGGLRHVRRVEWNASGSITLEDRVAGRGRHHVASRLLGPSPGSVRVTGPLKLEWEEARVSERFGRSVTVPAAVASGWVELPATFGFRLDVS